MLKIIPIDVGTFDALPKQTCMYRMYREITYEAPCIMWCIEGAKSPILIDLGPPDPPQVFENHGFVMRRTEKQQPPTALKAIGVEPDDVETVILTHLHWDHAWGFHFFENARFIIQRKEMEYAIAPLPCHRSLYYEKNNGKPSFVDYLDRIKIVDGDFSVVSGVEAIAIPSHTPGFQGVSVETEEGVYFIAGDAVGLFECWQAKPHIPSGIFNNIEDYYVSIDKIEKMADSILPGHDPLVLNKPYYP